MPELVGFAHKKTVEEIEKYGKLMRSYPDNGLEDKGPCQDGVTEASGLQKLLVASTPEEAGLHKLFSNADDK
ncbi:MAG: hypothetical protein HQL07_12890 [Nitrospirae bacterium]|nr:hypothetical protein [Magnetococcales bacterium]